MFLPLSGWRFAGATIFRVARYLLLTRYARPSGQPAAVTPLRYVSPLGESLLPVAAKVTKNACPDIRPSAALRVRYSLRSPFGPAYGCYSASLRFTPSSLQGHASKGHPWPIVALAASMPLNPFHDDSVHPPEGALARLILLCGGQIPPFEKGGRGDLRVEAYAAVASFRRLGAKTPVRRPSGGVAEGSEPHGCGERHNGPGMVRVCRPPERHRSEGSLAVGQTRMPGALLLWLLSSWACKKKVARPGGRKTRPSDSSKNSCTYRVPDQPKTKTLKGMVLSGLRREPDVC